MPLRYEHEAAGTPSRPTHSSSLPPSKKDLPHAPLYFNSLRSYLGAHYEAVAAEASEIPFITKVLLSSISAKAGQNNS